jgi:hypothetical protein
VRWNAAPRVVIGEDAALESILRQTIGSSTIDYLTPYDTFVWGSTPQSGSACMIAARRYLLRMPRPAPEPPRRCLLMSERASPGQPGDWRKSGRSRSHGSSSRSDSVRPYARQPQVHVTRTSGVAPAFSRSVNSVPSVSRSAARTVQVNFGTARGRIPEPYDLSCMVRL